MVAVATKAAAQALIPPASSMESLPIGVGTGDGDPVPRLPQRAGSPKHHRSHLCHLSQGGQALLMTGDAFVPPCAL
ncbi:hypothetical protein JCM4814A_22870 [Streptomyces phaeofaciens JCM 4814]